MIVVKAVEPPAPLERRADTIHTAPETEAELLTRAADLEAQADAELSAKIVEKLADTIATGKGIGDLIQTIISEGVPGADKLGQAGGVLGLIGEAAGEVITALENGKSPLDALLGMVGRQISGPLADLLPEEAQRALSMVSRVFGMGRAPGAAGFKEFLDVFTGADTSLGLPEFIGDGLMRMIAGEPLDPQRFLAGALRHVAKDLKQQALEKGEE